MDHYKELSKVTSIIGIAIAAVIGDFCRDWLRDQKVNSGLVLFIAVVFVVIVSQLSKLLINRFLNWAMWLRRLWLSHQFLEGVWIDIVKCQGNPIGFGVITVTGDADSIYFGGQDYFTSVESPGTFQSHAVIINWPIVTYTYSAHRGNKLNPLSSGFCQLRIEENVLGPPNHWTGVFIDLFDGTRHDVEAWKIEDKSTIKNLADPQKRKDTIKDLTLRYFGTSN